MRPADPASRTPSPARRRGTRLAVLVLAVMLASPDASSGTPPAPTPAPTLTPTPATVPVAAVSSPWAAEATTRIAAELTAAHQGVAELVALYAPDVEIDRRPWTGQVLQGRDAVLGDLRAAFGPAVDELEHQGLAIDPHGAAVQQYVSLHPRFAGPAQLLDVRDYGPHGMERSRVLASASMLQRSPTTTDAAFAPLERLVERYLAAWSGTGRDRWHDLYAADAVVHDGVGGLVLRGADAIAAHGRAAASADTVASSLTTIPGTDDPALYVDHRVPAAVTTVGLVMAPDEPAACPGRMTVVLELVEGRITRERRLRELGDVRRCEADPPAGWWEKLHDATPPAAERVTVLPDGTEVLGATPAMVGLVDWALGRFRSAGLSDVGLASVTFASGTARCDGIAGTVIDGARGAEVLLCLDEADVCPAADCGTSTFAARATVLHELAHVWEANELDDGDRERYLARTELATWFGAEVGWAARGGERAAEVLMWGLLDQEVPLPRLGRPPAEQLASEFRLLTGGDPPRDESAG
jgi:hypothetical protein